MGLAAQLPDDRDAEIVGKSMTALVIRHDFRPPPVTEADLYMTACWHIWRGWMMLAAIPLAIYIRGQR